MHGHLLDYAVVARNSPADIRQVLESYKGCDIPTEFIRRSKEHQRLFSSLSFLPMQLLHFYSLLVSFNLNYNSSLFCYFQCVGLVFPSSFLLL